MASIADDRGGGPMAYLREALALLASRRVAAPALAMTVLLTVSNIAIASNLPEDGAPPGAAFALAAVIRIGGLLVLGVALLRIMAGSARPPYRPDAAFWLYALTFLAGLGASVAVRLAVGAGDDVASIALVNAIVAVLLAPLTLWFGALAVERPLAWSPAPWLRGLGRWLPHFLFWTLLVVTPLGVLHAAIDMSVIKGDGTGFWPLMLLDGPLSAVMALLATALLAAAYRRVARR